MSDPQKSVNLEHKFDLSEPAKDPLAGYFGFKDGYFANFPSQSALSELSSEGIIIDGWGINKLGVAIAAFHNLPNIHYGKDALKREKQILTLASDLTEQLMKSRREKEGYRPFKRKLDWPKFGDSGPEDELDIVGICNSLQSVAKGAQERLEWLRSARDLAIDPKSNRADRARFFYWPLLIAFWRYHLGRDVGTSTGPKGAHGPLIKFIQIMSKGSLSASELRGTTVRAAIRRSEDRIRFFRRYFMPRQKTE